MERRPELFLVNAIARKQPAHWQHAQRVGHEQNQHGNAYTYQRRPEQGSGRY